MSEDKFGNIVPELRELDIREEDLTSELWDFYEISNTQDVQPLILSTTKGKIIGWFNKYIEAYIRVRVKESFRAEYLCYNCKLKIDKETVDKDQVYISKHIIDKYLSKIIKIFMNRMIVYVPIDRCNVHTFSTNDYIVYTTNYGDVLISKGPIKYYKDKDLIEARRVGTCANYKYLLPLISVLSNCNHQTPPHTFKRDLINKVDIRSISDPQLTKIIREIKKYLNDEINKVSKYERDNHCLRDISGYFKEFNSTCNLGRRSLQEYKQSLESYSRAIIGKNLYIKNRLNYFGIFKYLRTLSPENLFTQSSNMYKIGVYLPLIRVNEEEIKVIPYPNYFSTRGICWGVKEDSKMAHSLDLQFVLNQFFNSAFMMADPIICIDNQEIISYKPDIKEGFRINRESIFELPTYEDIILQAKKPIIKEDIRLLGIIIDNSKRLEKDGTFYLYRSTKDDKYYIS